MFWQVHWNVYMPVDGVEDWNGQIDDEEKIAVCNDYETAFDRFMMVTCDNNLARCWVTVHKNKDDNEGNVMLAYSNRWEDKININFE
jgi:hypothetical protein